MTRECPMPTNGRIAGRAGTHSVQALRAGGTRCERDDKGRAEQKGDYPNLLISGV